MQQSWYIKGGICLDPASGTEKASDLYIREGFIKPLPREIPADATIIDASGLVVVPGLIDIHVHLREPGNEKAETIESGSMAAAKGGFTTIVAMPNTQPATDSAEIIAMITRKSLQCGHVKVAPSACISRNREGKELTDLAALANAGAAAFTDDGSTITDTTLMSNAMKIAKKLRKTILDHALDPIIAGNGVMHEGIISKQLGLPGIPSLAEIKIVERDILLSGQTGCSAHIQHVSARESIDLIRQAHSKGIRVSAEATPHHLAFTDKDVSAENTNLKMNPPVRTEEDRLAILAAVADGTILALATDHAPHSSEAKARGFIHAPFGIIGLETAVGITFSLLVKSGMMPLLEWVRRWTTGPAKIMGWPSPSLLPGNPADITILDLESEWTVNSSDFRSKSRNMPFGGMKLTGRAVYTFLDGKMTWNDEKPQPQH